MSQQCMKYGIEKTEYDKIISFSINMYYWAN